MDKHKDLTQGSIPRVIRSMAAPLIGASFVQMAYSMTDMAWLGRLGSGPVAAVGAAFFFTWMNSAISFTPKTGAEITVSQSLGAGDRDSARVFANHAVIIAILLGLLFGVITLLGAPLMMGIFNLEQEIAAVGVAYLRWVIPGMFFTFMNNTYAAIYYGAGDSKTPFRYIGVGLVINILLDPLLIFGYGLLPAMGTQGAALATSLSQLMVWLLFITRLHSLKSPVGKLDFSLKCSFKEMKTIFRLGFPVSLQSALFSTISMTLASLASRFGHTAVAAYSLGSQIEAISWMTASGFSTALSSFVGQNYGAKTYGRIREAFRYTLMLAGTIGMGAGILFVMFAEPIFALFLNEKEALTQGALYLRIMGFSQFLMVIELVTAGAFNGVGKTQVPALTGISLNLLRIPMAFFLVSTPLELAGIWWTITITSCLKGAVLWAWFYVDVLRRLPKAEKLSSDTQIIV